MTVQKPEEFAKAVSKLADEPYLRLGRAYKILADADLPGLSFGVIGAAFCAGDYEDSRSFLTENLGNGTRNYESVLRGLEEIAKAYASVEQANLIDITSTKEIKAPRIEGVDENHDPEAFFAIRGGYVVALFAEAVLIRFFASTAAAISISAIAGVALTALYDPDDTALTNTQARWEEAAKLLEDFDENLQEYRDQLCDAWEDSDALDAYRDYQEALRKEIDEAKIAVKDGAKALQDLYDFLAKEQETWLISSILSVVALIALKILETAAPGPYKLGVRIAIEVAGAAFVVYTGTVTSAIFGLVTKTGTGIKGVSDQVFVTKKEATSDTANGVDFKEVADLIDIDKLVEKEVADA